MTTVVLACAPQLGPLTASSTGECSRTFYLPTPLACTKQQQQQQQQQQTEGTRRHSRQAHAAIKLVD